MTAINVVRFRVKPGKEKAFIDYNRDARRGFAGFHGGSIVKTGDHTFCLVGEWKNLQSMIDARPQMIGVLDGMRPLLEDLGGGLGVTDPVSGDVVLDLPGAPARVATKKTAKETANKSARKRAAPRRKAKKAAAKRRR